MNSSTPYAPQIKVPELLERGKSQTSLLPIYRDGALVSPTGVKYTLIAPDGSKTVDNATATYPGNIPQYTHSASLLSDSLNLGEGYVQEWTVTLEGSPFIFRRNAALVKRRLYPVISDGDLTSTYSQLADIRPSNLTSYQTYIDEAWYTMIQKLRQEGGGLEYLVMSAESFREAHQNLTLYYIFRDFHSSLGQSNGRYLDLAGEHFRQYHHAWKQINFIYDFDHSGTSESPNQRVAKQPVIYLCNPGSSRGRRR
jgi:hypothetical protein|tara:strand:+ start:9274 stop:10035 length:762 start_codon:yes stop_codon:yes gene_type:complete